MTDPTSVLALATGLLAIKMWLSGTITTYVRGRVMVSPNREDAAVMNFFNRVFRVPVQSLTAIDHNGETDPLVNRWLRICGNDASNIPIALLVFASAVATSSASDGVLVALIWVFVASRFVHTVVYAAGLQPWRTVAYSVGSIAWLVAAGSLLVG